jgi:hypothetical protein
VLKKIVRVVVVVTLSSFLVAQAGNQGRAATAADTACVYTFSSGAGLNATQFCVTANGNITQFSNPAGNDHIAGTWPSEGYAICDFTPATPLGYYDYATNESGNWLAPTLVSLTPTAVKLSRVTNDGIWQITQTITKVNATAMSPGSAKITMAVKNVSAVARTAYVLRFVDIDADNDYPDDDQLSSYRQYTGQDAFAYGLSLNSGTTATLVESLILNSNGVGPDPCNPGATYAGSAAFHGDGAGILWHLATFPKNGTKTFNMTYKAF